jgi:hypothetical protein
MHGCLFEKAVSPGYLLILAVAGPDRLPLVPFMVEIVSDS